ncbi:hypothetical protein ES708_25779 [subsurface metagenome]
MVVGNNNIQPHFVCFLDLGKTGNAAINSDNQVNALLVEVFQHGSSKPMTFGQAMWYVDGSLAAQYG